MTAEVMKAVLLTGFGGQEALVYREDVPVPVPGVGDVLIQVGACGVNNTDIWTREGAYGLETDPDAVIGWKREPMEFPRIQGADIAGRIVDVGAEVPDPRIGERVIVDHMLYGSEGDGLVDAGYIGSERDGGFAEYVAVPASNAHSVECSLSDAELATFPAAYQTAEHMLNRGRVTSGETVFVTGASGGVGSALVQLAVVRGARVIALVGPGKEVRVREIGAESVVTRDVTDLSATVAEALDGRAVDVVMDVVGGTLFTDMLRILRPMGRYVVAGAIAGPLVQLDLRTVYLKHLEMIGSTQGTREEFATVLGHVLAGRIRPLVALTYPLAEIKRAQDDFKAKTFFGKLVVLPQ